MFEMMFDGQAAWFGLPAVLGTIFFLVRMVLLLVGGDADGAEMDAGVDFDVDADFDAGDAHGDSGEAMKALSIQSIFTFMMGFGWGALAGLHGFGLDWKISLLAGVGVGLVMVWVLGLLLKAVHDLQSHGNVSIRDAVGIEGSVYVRVPPAREGRGQVTLVIDDRQRTFDAVTEGDALLRNARVRVVRVNDDHTLTVSSA